MSQLTTGDYIRQLQDADDDIRRNAAWRLGRLRDITIIEPLIAALLDSSAEVRVRVAEALAGQRDPRVLPAVIDALQTEADPDARIQMIHTLGYQAAPEALTMLETLIEQDRDADIRTAAASALGELRAFTSQRTIAILITALLQETELTGRYQMAQALQRIGGSEVAQAIIPVLSPQLDTSVQLQLIELLGGLADADATSSLTTFLDSDDEAVRETARWALERLQR